MKALLLSLGTRGDMEPLLAIGELLKSKGWQVKCLMPEQFREMVERMDLAFEGFDPAFLELLDGHDAKRFMGGQGSWWSRVMILFKMGIRSLKIQKRLLDQQHQLLQDEMPDRIIYHPKCIYCSVWSIANPGKSTMIAPMPALAHPIKDMGFIGINKAKDNGEYINLFGYWLANTLRAVAVYRSVKPYLKYFPKHTINASIIKRTALNTEKTLYTISPSLFRRPTYWPEAAQVVGYHERKKTINWQPPAELIDFLKKYKKVVFITFGSMTNAEPKRKSEFIVEALIKHKIAAIISTSWGGLEIVDDTPEHIYFTQGLPYDWIFPQVSAVVHHGGSGTTHTGLKYGCATLIVPHIVDQFMWARLIAKKKLGPQGVSIKKLNKTNFEELLLELINNPQYQDNVKLLAEAMEQEIDQEKLYEAISNQ